MAPGSLVLEAEAPDLCRAGTLVGWEAVLWSPGSAIEPLSVTSLVSTKDSNRIGRRVRQLGVLQEGRHRAAVDALVWFDAGQFEDGRGDVDVGRQLVRFGAGPNVRPADQEGEVGGWLVSEELAADQPVLAVEEAVVGGEDDVGVAQAVLRTQCVEQRFDPVVDRAQRLQRLVVVDAVGMDIREREVRRVADEARLVADVALGEAFGAVVRQGRALEPVVVARRRLGPCRVAEISVRGGVIELQVEGLFGRGSVQLADRDSWSADRSRSSRAGR